MKNKWLSKRLGIAVVASSLLVAGCTNENDSSNSESENQELKMGGILDVAYPTQPQTLDPHQTTAEATRDAAKNIYEGLVTVNSKYEVIPQLADSFEVSDDNKKVVFKLRKGIMFHNGKEMTSEDVVASMVKWSANKPELGEHEWNAPDEYTVELNLNEPSSLVMYFLADVGNLAAIMPKEIAEAAEATGAKEYIGTGPFEFVEWRQDEMISFKKFEDYVPDDDETDGLGGKKEAYVDEINWRFVPDASTRVNGLVSGEYDFAHMLSYDSIPQVESNPQVEVDVWPYGLQGLVFNKKEGIFSDVRARQAVNHALDMDVIMSAAFTGPDYYTLNPSLFLETQSDWYTDAGKENYNTKDLNKAKELLSEVGYDGEEVVILTSRDYEHHYNSAVATQQLLEEVGMNVKLDVYDWPTLLERRNDPSAYDIFFTGFSTVYTPHQFVFLDSGTQWPGWTNNPEIDGLLDQINASADQTEAKELYSQLQEVLWEDLPIINVGTNSRVSGLSANLEGFTNQSGPNFWNVSINE